MIHDDEVTVPGNGFPIFVYRDFVERAGIIVFTSHGAMSRVITRRGDGALLTHLDVRTVKLLHAPHIGYVWLLGGVRLPHLQSDGWGE